ncbi:acetyltransferase [Thozetella sp. PMI_491]|nr:acetyltransferase [Thozetella sp. PMI_491]
MDTYIRPLSVRDVERCAVVESAAFPPAEAATREKIEYRLTVCPEICFGLFDRVGAADTSVAQQQKDIPVLSEAPADSDDDVLVAHVISTRSNNKTVADEDMAYPADWRANPQAKSDVGHQPEGRTITLHSLAVAPARQNSGFGKALVKSYIEQMKQTGEIDRVAILTYDRLVSYYQKLGFTHYGKSKSEYAGVAWHDLAYEF